MPTYVAGDVRSIQEYIFGSPRLLEMRGASALLDFFDRRAVPELVKLHGGHTVFSGGGNFLATFPDEPQAEALIEAARHAFFELTGSDGITLTHRTGDSYRALEGELRLALRRAKRSPEGARQLASMPFLKRCESCGREAADEPLQVRDVPRGTYRWIGPICLRKHRMLGHMRGSEGTRPGEGPRHRVLGLPHPLDLPVVTPRLRAVELPDDFHELAGDDDLAVVVADGNSLGDAFEKCEIEEVERLSRAVDEALRAALGEAIEAVFGSDPNPRLQVLICGGDDLVVALPARKGLRFASALIESFEVPLGEGRVAGMAAGVLYAKPTFPFRQAHHLADSLLGRTKERCRLSGARSALDFHRVKATQVQSLEQEHAAIERTTRERSGWSYGASGPYTPDELGVLLALARKLRQVAPSQRGRLREILSLRDDGPETPLHPLWRIPERVTSELAAWHLRQEAPPFDLALDREPPEDLVREERIEVEGAVWSYRRIALADALLLADLGFEED